MDFNKIIASGAKGFTALGIFSLIDSGKLSLEDKAFGILPWEFPNTDRNITVRQLLSNICCPGSWSKNFPDTFSMRGK